MKWLGAGVLALALVACGGDDGKAEGTKTVAGDINHWAGDLASCLRTDPSSDYCRGADELVAICLGVTFRAVEARFGDVVTDADWDALSELCDQVDLLMSSPRMLAQREITTLRQQASRLVQNN